MNAARERAPGEGKDGAPLVRARGLGYAYPDGTRAVRDIDLDVRRGETLALIGPNGSGKSTLLRLLAAPLPPARGRVEGSVDRPFAERPAFVPDDPVFRDALGAAGQAAALLRLRGVERAEAERRTAAWLERMGLGTDAERPVGTFSRGMRARLGLAVAFASRPPLLLLDEPVAALDPEGRERLAEALDEARRRDAGIVLSVHDPGFAAAHADRVAFLRGGRLVAADGPDRFLAALGAAARIDVELADLPSRPDVRIPAGLAEGIEWTDAGLVARVRSPSAALPPLLEALYTAGARVRGLRVREPDLRDVYFALTGTSLE